MNQPVGAGQGFGLAFAEPLFPYQEAGVERLVREPAVLLADEMGLGKTIQAVAALRVLAAQGAAGAAVIVAPSGLVLQWRQQLRRWAPELRLSTAIGSPEERGRAWRAEAQVFLTGYEALRSDIWSNAPGMPGTRMWDVAVIDEAQRIKTAGAATAQAVKRLKRKRSWALTGTPLENRIDDLISILDFVAPGRFDPSAMAVGLRKLLAEVQLRRRRSEVLTDLPPKFAQIARLELGRRQRAAYDRARREGLFRLGRLGRELRISHVLELILRLKQICNFCPETGESAKLDDLKARLAPVAAAGEKALVFSQFVNEPFGARRIAAGLSGLNPLVFAGDIDREARAERIAEFERDTSHVVLVLSLRAGGVGLNLTAASHVFHFDRWWNPAVEAQAEDRSHRMGQERPVEVVAYLTEDTIEQRIEEVLSEKRMLFADIVDGIDTRALGRLDLDTLLAMVRET